MTLLTTDRARKKEVTRAFFFFVKDTFLIEWNPNVVWIDVDTVIGPILLLYPKAVGIVYFEIITDI